MPSVILPSGCKLAYRETGSGAPLVMVHGSPGEGRGWSRVAQRLTAGHRVLMPELPGYGGSDPLPSSVLDRTAAMGGSVVIWCERFSVLISPAELSAAAPR